MDELVRIAIDLAVARQEMSGGDHDAYKRAQKLAKDLAEKAAKVGGGLYDELYTAQCRQVYAQDRNR
jgi:hypothetical protein